MCPDNNDHILGPRVPHLGEKLKRYHHSAEFELRKRADAIIGTLNQYNIPAPNAQKIADHAIKALCNNPSWKPEKVVRKTVEYFKLKKKERK